jgi:D-tyrosyl-tRNA(Tyr) deacylase
MRAVIQRVASARVTVDDRPVGAIDRGLLVFAGVEQDDGLQDVEYIASKVQELRIFEDEAGKMNRSVIDAGGALLVVSQFTLCGDCRTGRRPSFDVAAPPQQARPIYEDLVRTLRSSALKVETGEFQAHMHVELINDGPVTILLDSRRRW